MDTDIADLINRRQRQLLVHSIIYYKLNDSLISDDQWKKWAVELEDLQKKYPEIALKQRYGPNFVGFDHSTGYNLPLYDPDAFSIAYRLVKMKSRKGN